MSTPNQSTKKKTIFTKPQEDVLVKHIDKLRQELYSEVNKLQAQLDLLADYVDSLAEDLLDQPKKESFFQKMFGKQ